MFINISNHPSSKWSPAQLAAAGGKVVDIPFPNVPPTATPAEVEEMAQRLLDEVAKHGFFHTHTAMVQGEFSLTYALTGMLIRLGTEVVVATSFERKSVENPDGSKTVVFEFVQFRRIYAIEQ